MTSCTFLSHNTQKNPKVILDGMILYSYWNVSDDRNVHSTLNLSIMCQSLINEKLFVIAVV